MWSGKTRLLPMDNIINKIVDYGYGSELHYVMRAVNEGLRDGYGVYPVNKLNLAELEDTCYNNHLCFFEPYYWMGCSNSYNKNIDQKASSADQHHEHTLVSTSPAELAPWLVPAPFSYLGIFEYRSLTAAFIHRPNAQMRSRVKAVVQKIGFSFEKPCMGVHIRRGDSCNDKEAHRECFDNSKYIEAMVKLRLKYDIHCAYIATDDETAPFAIQEAFNSLDATANALLQTSSRNSTKLMKIFEQQNDRSAYSKCPGGLCTLPNGKKIYLENERHLYKGSQGFQLATEMLIDIELLASCVAFIGTMSSNNFRLAVELSYARKGLHSPFISLDTSWCWFGFGDFHIKGSTHKMYC